MSFAVLFKSSASQEYQYRFAVLCTAIEAQCVLRSPPPVVSQAPLELYRLTNTPHSIGVVPSLDVACFCWSCPRLGSLAMQTTFSRIRGDGAISPTTMVSRLHRPSGSRKRNRQTVFCGRRRPMDWTGSTATNGIPSRTHSVRHRISLRAPSIRQPVVGSLWGFPALFMWGTKVVSRRLLYPVKPSISLPLRPTVISFCSHVNQGSICGVRESSNPCLRRRGWEVRGSII